MKRAASLPKRLGDPAFEVLDEAGRRRRRRPWLLSVAAPLGHALELADVVDLAVPMEGPRASPQLDPRPLEFVDHL